jgi:hypothetical protein
MAPNAAADAAKLGGLLALGMEGVEMDDLWAPAQPTAQPTGRPTPSPSLSPTASRLSPTASRQSPTASPQSPTATSQTASRQSPTASRQTPTASRQTPTASSKAKPVVAGAAKDFANFWLASKQDRVLGGNCQTNPLGCVQQLVIGTLAVAAAWTVIAWYVDGKPPDFHKVLKFCAIFLPVSFFLRWLDVEIQDKLSIAAGMTLGNKMVQILTV